ncbi:MAG: hypothetical protein ACI9D5_000187 [Candidatus Endobugula sp.]|jgi:hypothetical protein
MSFKHLFAQHSFSLQRIESICAMIDLPFSGVALLMGINSQLPKQQWQNITLVLASRAGQLKWLNAFRRKI